MAQYFDEPVPWQTILSDSSWMSRLNICKGSCSDSSFHDESVVATLTDADVGRPVVTLSVSDEADATAFLQKVYEKFGWNGMTREVCRWVVQTGEREDTGLMWITEVGKGPTLSDPDFVANARQDIELQRAFKHFDTDGSGKLDVIEMKRVLQDMGSNPLTDDQVQSLLTNVDVDGDGLIDYGEFVQFLLQHDTEACSGTSSILVPLCGEGAANTSWNTICEILSG